jgi:hypothetical protein
MERRGEERRGEERRGEERRGEERRGEERRGEAIGLPVYHPSARSLIGSIEFRQRERIIHFRGPLPPVQTTAESV